MELSEPVKKILSFYESDNPGTKANLARILLQGKLGGTGRLLILPVDQGVEHGPARSFGPNPPAYDPHYHYQLALDAGLSAYAAPLGFLEAAPTPLPGGSRRSSSSTTPTACHASRRTRAKPSQPMFRTRCGSAVRRSATRSIRARMRRMTRCATSPRWRPRRSLMVSLW
jgi:hypothetical protein